MQPRFMADGFQRDGFCVLRQHIQYSEAARKDLHGGHLRIGTLQEGIVPKAVAVLA